MSESKGKWGYLVASAFVSSLIGYFAPKMLDAVIPWLSENPLSQYPMETIGIAVTASLIGFLAGSKFGKTRVAKPRKLTQGEIKSENAEVAAKNRRVIMELSSDLKTMFKTAVVKSCVYCKTDDWRSFAFNNSDFYAQLVESENIDRKRTRIRPTGLLRSLVEENADLFDFVSDKAMAEYAVYDPSEKAHSNVLYSGGRLVWWWYSHDPNIDRNKTIEQAIQKVQAKNDLKKMPLDERLKRLCATMSKRKKAIVLDALDSGEIHLSSFDADALSLCDANILKAPPIMGRTTGTNFFINPSYVIELKENRQSWLGYINKKDRDKLINGE